MYVRSAFNAFIFRVSQALVIETAAIRLAKSFSGFFLVV